MNSRWAEYCVIWFAHIVVKNRFYSIWIKYNKQRNKYQNTHLLLSAAQSHSNLSIWFHNFVFSLLWTEICKQDILSCASLTVIRIIGQSDIQKAWFVWKTKVFYAYTRQVHILAQGSRTHHTYPLLHFIALGIAFAYV